VERRILAVAGDLGGWNALSPALKLLAEEAKIFVRFTGVCRTKYGRQELKCDERFLVVDHFSTSEPGLLVLGASHEKESVFHARLAKSLNPDSRICLVEDMYGSGLPILREIQAGVNSTPKLSVCVIDEFARDLLFEGTDLHPAQIVVTGGPQFDKVVWIRERWNELRRDIRKPNDRRRRFLIVGGLDGTAEMMAILFPNLLKDDVVTLRTHPRATELDRYLTAAMLPVYNNNHVMMETHPVLFSAGVESLLPAVDFVLSGYSTVAHFAIALGIPGVIYIGTPAIRANLWEEKQLRVPVEADMGAAWYVTDSRSLAMVLSDIEQASSDKYLTLLKQQKIIANHCDGQASQRVANVLRKMLEVS